MAVWACCLALTLVGAFCSAAAPVPEVSLLQFRWFVTKNAKGLDVLTSETKQTAAEDSDSEEASHITNIAEGDVAGGGGGKSARVMLQKELSMVAAMRAGIAKMAAANAKMAAANAEMAAANAVTRQRLDAVEVALQHHLQTATTASPTTASTVSAPPSPQSDDPSASPPTPSRRPLTNERKTLSEALMAAARRGAVQEMRQLLAEGADAQYQNSKGETALQGAAEKGHVDGVRLLLDSGALVDEADGGGNTALNFAAWRGHTACVAALVEAGADVESRNSWGHTPLRDAAVGNHEEVVRALLAAGADPGVEDDDGKTARDVTASGAIRAMLAASDVTTATLTSEERTELSKKLLETAEDDNWDDMRQLLADGADVHSKGHNGYTAIHWAAWNGNVEALQSLIARGANVDVGNIYDNTPLHWAAWNGKVATLEALAANGANLNARNVNLWTPLHYAAHENREKTVVALLALGADPALKDNEGKTARRRATKPTILALLPA